MARKKKKKSLLLTGAGLAARILLEKRIIKKEQKRAAARAEGGRSALQARVKKPVLDEALYHALGGKASNDSLKLKAARKALKSLLSSAISAHLIIKLLSSAMAGLRQKQLMTEWDALQL